jgi:hypothetical protein
LVLTNVVVLETRKYLWNGDINASEIPDPKLTASEGRTAATNNEKELK